MEVKHHQAESYRGPLSEALLGTIRRVFDAFEKRPYQVLHGTGTVLDGTVLATANSNRPFQEQITESLLILNDERKKLRLGPVVVTLK